MSESYPASTGAHIVALTEALDGLNDGLARLRGDVRREADARHRENLINVGVAAAMLLMILGVLSVSITNTRLARQNQRLSRQVQTTSEQIRDCTQPGGHCYEDGRKRTGDAVAGIVRGQVAVAECTKTTGSDAALETCVRDKLAAPTPTPTR